MRTHGKLLTIVDGTNVKLGGVEPLSRVCEKAIRLFIDCLYALGTDIFSDTVVTFDAFSEIKTIKNHLFYALVKTGFFWKILATKRFDVTDVMEALERHELIPNILARVRGR